MKSLLCILAALTALILLVAVTTPRGHPDKQRTRRDFLAEHPTYTIERVVLDEQEVVAMSDRIFYRVPGDTSLHEEFRHYLYSDGHWRLSHKPQEK